jgi:hypothetical protein
MDGCSRNIFLAVIRCILGRKPTGNAAKVLHTKRSHLKIPRRAAKHWVPVHSFGLSAILGSTSCYTIPTRIQRSGAERNTRVGANSPRSSVRVSLATKTYYWHYRGLHTLFAIGSAMSILLVYGVNIRSADYYGTAHTTIFLI